MSRDRGRFSESTSINTYAAEFLIYGLGKTFPFPGPFPFKYCFRYEIANLGPSDIQELRWPHARLAGLSLLETERVVTVLVDEYASTDHIAEYSTELRAFGNAPAIVKTVLSGRAIEQAMAIGTLYHQGAGPDATVQVWELDGIEEVVRAFAESNSGINVQPAELTHVAAVPLAEEATEYPELRLVIATDGKLVDLRSNAAFFPSDRFATTGVDIEIVREDVEDPAHIFAPHISATRAVREKLPAPESIADDVREFLFAMTADTVGRSLEDTEIQFAISLSADAGRHPLFIVRHPVTIRIGDWAVCLMVESYSTIPVSLYSTGFCNEQ